jgi:hypothetical protein
LDLGSLASLPPAAGITGYVKEHPVLHLVRHGFSDGGSLGAGETHKSQLPIGNSDGQSRSDPGTRLVPNLRIECSLHCILCKQKNYFVN